MAMTFTPCKEVKTPNVYPDVNASTHLKLRSVPASLVVPVAVRVPILIVHLGQNEQVS